MDIQINPHNNNVFLKLLLSNNINGLINWLHNSANFGPARKDGTPVNRMMVTRSWFDVYTTTGLGKNESASKMDCVIQIMQLMKEHFGVSRLGSHKLPTNTKCFNDLPNAIYVAENASMLPREQTAKLGILGYFLDTGNSKPPLEMLHDISNILITRPRETFSVKSGMHVCNHYVNLYCSTGLGLSAHDAKIRSAEQMLNTLRRLCGFVPAFKLPEVGDPGNDGNDYRMWLSLPTDDQYKIKLIKYFLESSSVPHAVQLNELAIMLKVVVKYSDTGNNNKPGVACEFGPHVTVGVGSTKMISVFRSRTAMLNKLKLVCGYVQFPRTFVPLDCLGSTTMAEYHGKNYGRQKVSIPSFPRPDHPPNEAIEPLESRNPMSDRADTTAIPTANAGETIEIVVQDGVVVRGAFNPICRQDHNYSPLRPLSSIRGSSLTQEDLAESFNRELDVGR